MKSNASLENIKTPSSRAVAHLKVGGSEVDVASDKGFQKVLPTGDRSRMSKKIQKVVKRGLPVLYFPSFGIAHPICLCLEVRDLDTSSGSSRNLTLAWIEAGSGAGLRFGFRQILGQLEPRCTVGETLVEARNDFSSLTLPWLTYLCPLNDIGCRGLVVDCPKSGPTSSSLSFSDILKRRKLVHIQLTRLGQMQD